jgi:general secretion pathway protein D
LPENVDDVFQPRLPVASTKPTLPQSYQHMPSSPTSTQPMVETTPVTLNLRFVNSRLLVFLKIPPRVSYTLGSAEIGLNLMMQNVQGARGTHGWVVSRSYSIPERYTENVSIGSA